MTSGIIHGSEKKKQKKKNDKLENSSKAFEILTFVFLTLYLVKNEFKLFLDNWVKKKKIINKEEEKAKNEINQILEKTSNHENNLIK